MNGKHRNNGHQNGDENKNENGQIIINYSNNNYNHNLISPNKLKDSIIESLHNDGFSSTTSISSVIYTKEHPSYSTVLNAQIRNLRFMTPTTPKPLLIITPLHASHVQGAVTWAKKKRLQMKIRSGGHDYEGLSYVSNAPFFILDMFNLRSVKVNVEDETAWVQTGATLGEVIYHIAKSSNVLGFPAGVCPTVGVGGHFSGAGYGNMMRKYGLTVDNVVDAEIVDVNGRLLNRETMGEDLFWAIRGGGGASFGVILSYKIKLVKVPEIVTIFRVSRTIEEGLLDIVLQWQKIASTIDENLFLRLTMDAVDGLIEGEKTVKATFNTLFLGDSKTLLSLVGEQFPKLGLSESDCYEASWVDSVIFWADDPIGTPIESLLRRAPSKLSHLTRKSDYVRDPISRDGYEFIFGKLIELKDVRLTFNPYGGKMSEIAENAAPFPHRKGNLFKIQYLCNWEEGGEEKAKYYMDLVRELYGYMTPYVSKYPRRAYYNYRDLDLGVNQHNDTKSYIDGRKYGIQYFVNNFDRLVKVKAMVDPENYFRNEQSIPLLPPTV
ncbi:hypothetical protein vseg_007481 [Gypsophila vaccaria]